MSAAAFRSRWHDFTPEARPHPTDSTDTYPQAGASSTGSALPPRPALPLAEVGDLAEAVREHCANCDRCTLDAYIGDRVVLPLCAEGLELRRRYRHARTVALGETQ